MKKLLPRMDSHVAAINTGSETLMAMPASLFIRD